MLGDSGEKKQEEPSNITRPRGGSDLPRLVGERGETWGREKRDQEQELLNLRLAVVPNKGRAKCIGVTHK